MNCCFNNCYNRCNRDVIVGPTGPMGPQGPRGYTGAPGAQGVTPAIYAGITTASTVANNAIIPIGLIANTTNSTFTVTNNAINVPAGQYLVSYGMNGYEGTDTGTTTVSLYVNGSAQANETLSETASSTAPASASKTMLLTLSSAGTIALYNTSGASATFNSAYITVTQLATNS